MEVTKPYEFIRFGAMEVTKPYEFIGFGAKRGFGDDSFAHTPVSAAPQDSQHRPAHQNDHSFEVSLKQCTLVRGEATATLTKFLAEGLGRSRKSFIFGL